LCKLILGFGNNHDNKVPNWVVKETFLICRTMSMMLSPFSNELASIILTTAVIAVIITMMRTSEQRTFTNGCNKLANLILTYLLGQMKFVRVFRNRGKPSASIRLLG